MSDLIERLKWARRMVAGQNDVATIDEAITALSPAMPDEVTEMVTDLHIDYARSVGGAASRERKAAHMLERQQRAYAGIKGDMKQSSKLIAEQQDRIEELDTLVSALEEVRAKEYTHKQQRIEDLEAQVAALEDTASYLSGLSIHQADELIAENEDLQAQIENAEGYLWDAASASQWEDYRLDVPHLESEYTKENDI